MVQGAEAAPEGFVPLEDTWRCSLHLQEGEGSSAGAACSVSVHGHAEHQVEKAQQELE